MDGKMLKMEVLKAGLLCWCCQVRWKLNHAVYFKKLQVLEEVML